MFYELWEGTREEFDAVQGPNLYRKAYMEKFEAVSRTLTASLTGPHLCGGLCVVEGWLNGILPVAVPLVRNVDGICRTPADRDQRLVRRLGFGLRLGTRLNGDYGEAPFLGTHPVDSTQYARRSPRAYALSKAWMKAGFNGRRRAVFPVASKRAAAIAGAASAFAASDPPP